MYRITAIAIGLSALTAMSAAAQPTLTPPAGSPTESGRFGPAIVINSQNTPGDANSAFRITSPGNYILMDNIFVPSNEDAIQILSSDVNIDMNGYRIFGTADAGSAAFRVELGAPGTQITFENFSVRNGTIRNVGNAFELNDSEIDTSPPVTFTSINITRGTYENLNIFGVRNALDVDGAVIRNCIISAQSRGINASYSVISDCTVEVDATLVSGNGTGIAASTGSTVSNCVVRARGQSDTAYSLSQASSASGCGAFLSGTQATGFRAIAGSSLQNCTVSGGTVDLRRGIILDDATATSCGVYRCFTAYTADGDSVIRGSTATSLDPFVNDISLSVILDQNNF